MSDNPLALAQELSLFAQHRLSCAIYQSSWANGAPDCSCGLDALRSRAWALRQPPECPPPDDDDIGAALEDDGFVTVHLGMPNNG